MTASDPDDARDAPWAGDVPVPPPPVEFTWARTGDSAGAALGEPASPGAGGPDVGRRWLVGSIAAVLLLVVGWLAVGRGGDDAAAPTDTADTSDTTAAPPADTELDALPGIEPEAPVRTLPVTTNGGATEPEPAEWRQDVVELPAALRAVTEPYELVALTSDGTFLQIGVPSGRVDALDGIGVVDGQVVAGATTTLVTSYSSRTQARLVSVGNAPITATIPDNIDRLRALPMSDRFVGIAYNDGTSLDEFVVDADGTVTVSSLGDDSGIAWQQAFLADGSRLVSEAGGLYVDDGDTFRRVSTGFLLAATGDLLLVRECDEAMRCGEAVLDASTGDRTDITLGPDTDLDLFSVNSAQLSPDGGWLHVVAYTESSVDDVVIDLATGTVTELSGSPRPESAVWAADGSGLFRSSVVSGFEYFDVATGDVIRFGEELGRLGPFDVRTFVATPTPVEVSALATGIELIGVTPSGDIVEIDVDSGATVVTDGIALGSTAPMTVFAFADGAIVTSWDNVESVRFVAATGTVTATGTTRPGGPLVAGPTAGTVWQFVERAGAGGIALELVDVRGDAVGPTIETDATDVNGLIGSDGRGGVVVELDLGGVYVLDADADADADAGVGVERVTSGELLGIGADVAYVRECDEALRCGVFRVDRTTAERTSVDGAVFDRADDARSGDVPSGASVSPDGDLVLVGDGERADRTMMIDTVADLWTGLPAVDLASPVIWTADSSAAVWLSDGRVVVYERASRSVRTLNTVALAAIGVRPERDR